MTFSHSVYFLLIKPLELLFEVVYGFSRSVTENGGLSIVLLSLSLNILLLPLYRRADAIQAEERETEQRLSRGVEHIKKAFHGDERFMILQTYYRQNKYKPFYALKGTMPLLLEVPFFIAAYRFLSNLEELKGLPFGPIGNLGMPDELLTVAGFTIHVLPIAMTLINFVSSAIYTKGLPAKDKVQLYGMALIFLVLLYESPSGLVLYWTLNNLFSLIKNLFYKLRDPRRTLRILLSAAGVLLLIYCLGFYHTEHWKRRLFVIMIGIVLELPVLLHALGGKLPRPRLSLPEGGNARLFVSGCVFLAVLTGILIPSSVIRSSPSEFVQLTDFYTPIRHVLNASLLSFGLFVIWLGVFYYMASKKARWVFDLSIWLVSGIAVADYMFFGTDLGTLSAELIFDSMPVFSPREELTNLAVIFALIVLLTIVYHKKQKLLQSVYLILIIAIIGMSSVNIWSIQTALPQIKKAAEYTENEKAHATLSKNGKNVIVFMLDRAISAYLPYIFEEKPEVEQQFEGFTYYPNTISFGGHTNFGCPALYGGYEYTPEEMNKRSNEPLADKHDEALKLMPALFDGAGYEVTVFDPTYAGYNWIPDLSIYSEYQHVHAYNTELGRFSALSDRQNEYTNQCWERNFFCYSMMKISPVSLQSNLYHDGGYYWPKAEYSRAAFMNPYSVLCSLPTITRISAGEENHFLMISNTATHEPTVLQEPEYEPAYTVNNAAYDKEHEFRTAPDRAPIQLQGTQIAHYHVNMAAMIKIGRWLDYMRDNDVYDNTRIIIVADHGYDLNQFDELMYGEDEQDDVMFYNPLLMVKDFNCRDFSTSWDFMTNADVPTLAMADCITAPTNPFTGKPVTSEAKNLPEQHILTSHEWSVEKNNGNTFLPGVWYAVHDNIFDVSNWKKLGNY